jgi:perosamine synthetase
MVYITADPLLDGPTLRAARHRLASDPPGLEGARYLESGRVALWAVLRALGLKQGDELVVPAYICDSILPAPAALGIQVRYVGVDRELRLDLETLQRAVAAGARAALVVHYFGFPAPDFEAVAALCAQARVPLIEDCAQALFSQSAGQPLGSRGSAAIFSPWKSLPLPDGGALVLHGSEPLPDLRVQPRPAAASTARRLAYRSISVVESALGFTPRLWLLRSWGLRRAMQAQTAAEPLVPRRASALAEAIMRGVDWRWVVERRRRNYAALATVLRDKHWATLLQPDLAPGICPLGLPILVERREAVRRALLAAGVNVRAYWEQLPTEVSVEAFADAWHVANRILILPVHQSLTPVQLRHLCSVLESIDV